MNRRGHLLKGSDASCIIPANILGVFARDLLTVTEELMIKKQYDRFS